MTPEESLNKYKAELPRFCTAYFNHYDDKLSVKTLVAYATDIKVFFEYLVTITDYSNIKEIEPDVLDRLTDEDIDDYLAWLSHYTIGEVEYSNSPAGKKRKLASLNAFFKYLRKVGKMKNNPTEFTEAINLKKKAIVVLSDEEQENLLSNVEYGSNKTGRELLFHEKTKLRDLAIVSLFLGTGIRVSELVGLNDDNFDAKEQRILVTRKGGNQELVYFNEEVAARILEYMELERPTLLGYKDEVPTNLPLFVSLKKTRISTRMVEIIIKNYAKFVLPPGLKITPHTLRKTFGTKLYNKYRDLYLTQKALGHASPETTAKYYTKFDKEYLKKMREFDIKNS